MKAQILVDGAEGDDADLTITVEDGVVNYPEGVFAPRRNNPSLAYESVAEPPSTTLGWTLDPVTAAIALAYHLGARDIHVYGVDISMIQEFEGCLDCRGQRPLWMGDTRLGVIYLMSSWLKSNGATLNAGVP